MKRRQVLLAGAAMLAAPARAEPALRLVCIEAWPCSLLATQVAALAIRRRFGRQVAITSVDAGPMWAAVASGHADATLSAWLPTTSAAYWERYRGRLVNLGTLTEGVWLGLAVPDYVPIDTIAAVQDQHARLHGQIIGIEAGAGIMEQAQRAIAAYGLRGLRLRASSTAAMQAQLQRAVARRAWVVATLWRPLGIWSRLALRPLADPLGAFGNGDRIDVVANPSLRSRDPQVWSFLQGLRLPLPELEAMMADYDRGAGAEQVAARWLDSHPLP
jgi:glycine betaine/proline transport system substrate-binding protein